MAHLISPQFWYRQLFAPIDYAPQPALLTGRVAVVTGANTGLGLETAVHLARLSPKLVILAVRNVGKGGKAKEYVVSQAGIDSAKVEVWEVDLSSFDSVKAFATRCEAELDRLDILVNNAGLGALKFNKTVDGYEEMLQVNVLSTGLLSVLLLPLLAKSATVNPGAGSKEFSPHLTIVASSTHKSAVYVRPSSSSLLLDLNDPTSPNTGLLNGYRLTKLLDVFLSRKLAVLPLAEKVTVNSVDPGLCKSDLRRNAPGLVAWLSNAIAWRTETEAACIAHAATAPTPSGAYVEQTQVGEPSEFVQSEEGRKLEDDLWKELVELWAGTAPEVGKAVA